MRSLALKLTLAFLFVSLVGAVLAAFFIQQRTQTEFDRFLFDLDKSNITDFLTQYYREVGSWENVDLALMQLSAVTERHPMRRLPFTLVDANGRILYGGMDHPRGQVVRDYEKGVPIEVDGVVVGWLLVSRFPVPWSSETPEAAFLKNVTWAILTSALIAVVIALVLGAFLARTLTRPLRELTHATQLIAQGKLGYQVQVRSQDELGDLASSFNQMSADLEKSNQARRQMTADVAHDLRTPLSVILGYTEALSDGKLLGAPEVYAVLHQEASHLQVLIDDLRTLSLADAGELPFNLQQAAPGALLSRCAAALKPQAEAKHITLQVQADKNLPDIRVDPERMAQVLGNLVNNALRHTPEGGLVELSAVAEKGGICLRVRDTGSGIAAQDLPFIFNRFYRGSKSRTQNGEAGLGLTIARSLVEAQGGGISVESEPGSGATFTIRFPRAQ
jgi:signal transduction histidine kinase